MTKSKQPKMTLDQTSLLGLRDLQQSPQETGSVSVDGADTVMPSDRMFSELGRLHSKVGDKGTEF